jgi:hypothetical protein
MEVDGIFDFSFQSIYIFSISIFIFSFWNNLIEERKKERKDIRYIVAGDQDFRSTRSVRSIGDIYIYMHDFRGNYSFTRFLSTIN